MYSDEFLFGLIADGVQYLQVDDSNRANYSARGITQSVEVAMKAPKTAEKKEVCDGAEGCGGSGGC